MDSKNNSKNKIKLQINRNFQFVPYADSQWCEWTA